ncbi:hypothetical protein [Lysinibacillus xylanilyticus]|uniref:hypothetical protein n=1 Tax=Lysinibacillus xylanilyticus TaxID=582475 RepID=UPI0036DB1150
MDLYIQVGVLLAIMSMFALVAYFYSVSYETGWRISRSLDKPSVNYSMDSSITTPTFFVDHRNFTQWAINAKGQRQVYLMYPQNIVPADDIYAAYLHRLTVKMSDTDLAYRKLEVHPQVSGDTNNAYYVNDQSPKTVDYLTVFSQEAKAKGKNKMVTVYTFTDNSTGEVIYVCYIK